MHAGHSPQTILLLDGPLSVSGPTKRQRLVSDMASDLIRFDAFRSEDEAIRSLYGTGRYQTFDIMALIDDARQVAMCEVVAREMGEA